MAGVLSQRIYREIFNMEAGLNTRISRVGTYAGNFEPYEKIELPEGEIFNLNNTNEGETGNEIDDSVLPETQPLQVIPNHRSVKPTTD